MRTEALARRPKRMGSQNEGTKMRKKTAPTTRKHGQTSHPEEKGLIVKGKKARQSAVETCALDDLSHRTSKFQGQGARWDSKNSWNHAGPLSPANGVRRARRQTATRPATPEAEMVRMILG